MDQRCDDSQDEHQSQPLWEDVYFEDEPSLYFDSRENSPAPRDNSPYPFETSIQYIKRSGLSRYRSAAKNFLPVRRITKKVRRLGIDEAGFWSFVTLSWITKIMTSSRVKVLTLDDIPEPSPYDSCEYNVQRFESLWQDEVMKKGTVSASLGYVTWRFIRTRFIISSFLLFIYVITGFISVVFFTRYLMEYLETKDASYWDGIQWAGLLTLTELFRYVLYATCWAMNYRTGIRLRAACLAMVYRKILRTYCLEDKKMGEFVSIFSNDGPRIFESMIYIPMLTLGPTTLIIGVVYVWWQLGPLAILGFLSYFVFFGLQFLLSRLSGYFRRKAVKATDERLDYLSELLHCIKFIKFSAWGQIFKDKITESRKKELRYVTFQAYCQSSSSTFSNAVPAVATILTILPHIATYGVITASQAFTILTLNYKLIRYALLFTRDSFSSIVDLNLALRRIKEVLLLNETPTYLSKPLDRSQAVCIANGHFSKFVKKVDQVAAKDFKIEKNGVDGKHESGSEAERKMLNSQSESPFQEILSDINFYAPKGSLIGIYGSVGCGKSSLLKAILGQLKMTKGKLCRVGRCAYVSQEPWLMNASLKENILFGEKFNAKRYFAVLHCCALNEDIDALPGADETEIGERGFNLSGGQKQRVSLARALYSNRDVYLLDDPLSAVDYQVSSRIFDKCVLFALKHKTVILVTHQEQFLNQCNEIVLMKDGRIIDRGTFKDVTDRNVEYKRTILKKEDAGVEEAAVVKPSQRNALPELRVPDQIITTLTVDEKIERGSVKWETYQYYTKASGNYFFCALAIFVMFLNLGSSAFSSWWLAIWINDGSGHSNSSQLCSNTTGSDLNATDVPDVNDTDVYDVNATDVHYVLNFKDNSQFYTYQLIYLLSVVFIIASSILRGLIFTKVTLKASSTIHKDLLDKLLRAKMIFFETIPLGRYQNLFSKDFDDVEMRLSKTLEVFFQGFWHVAFSLLFICLAFPVFIVPICGLLVIYHLINRVFRVAVRDLKRLDNATRSPVISNVSSTINGLDIIHAFEKEKSFLNRYATSFDINGTCLFMYSIANRWLSLRVDVLAVLLLVVTSILLIFTHGSVSPALASLALTYAVTLSGMVQRTVRVVTENESSFLTLERIISCNHSLEPEGGHGPKGIPPNNWPQRGAITFKNVKFRYRPGLPFVVNDVSFYTNPSEKIIIIGRTGAGKSSLVSILFRLVEITEGSVVIDHLDISSLDLVSLRNRMSIIPQDPVLFSGTIRTNLDPTNLYNDDQIWGSLDKVKLKHRIELADGKLDCKVTFNGGNFSTGEKQQICLARALLKQTKILVLDEATAGLDLETEKQINEALFTQFKHSTLIMIAHRVQNLTAWDRVIVVDSGKIVENDEPSILLSNPNSYCNRLLKGDDGARGEPAGVSSDDDGRQRRNSVLDNLGKGELKLSDFKS